MTPRQKQVLDCIRERLAVSDVPPSCEEIAAAVGLKSKGNVSKKLAELEAQGYIRRRPRRVRSIELVKASSNLAAASDAALLAEVARRGLLHAEARHA